MLELNADHAMFKKLQSLYENDKEKLKAYSEILYTQALLIEGMPIEDPLAYSNLVCELMVNQ